jgi:4'-phosphopantetheinyl transferase
MVFLQFRILISSSLMLMIEIWFVRIEHLSFTRMQQLLHEYPEAFQKEVNRYRQQDDQKRKLLGRELIRFYLKSKDYETTVHEIKFDQHKKPYLENGPFFNISHSGNYVVAAFSKNPVGIDIEEERAVDVTALSFVFHTDELAFLKENNYQQSTFYRLWARKEACLKAIGIGIIHGLDHWNALNDLIKLSAKEWHIQEVQVRDGYQCAVCVENAPLSITIKEVDVLELTSSIGS